MEAKTAWEKGADSLAMAPVLQLIRQSQWRWDMAAAGHGNAFHAPVETARILHAGLEKAQEARIQLARMLQRFGVDSVAYPGLESKAQAQEFIALNMDQKRSDKQRFLTSTIPLWLSKAKERESKY